MKLDYLGEMKAAANGTAFAIRDREVAPEPKSKGVKRVPLGIGAQRSRGRPPKNQELRAGGFYEAKDLERIAMIEKLFKEFVNEKESRTITILRPDNELTAKIAEMESAAAEVRLIIVHKAPQKLILPQPHLPACQVLLKSYWLAAKLRRLRMP